MSQQRDRPQTMRELTQKEAKPIPTWMLATVNVLYAVPLIVLLLYSIGWMEFQKDSFDNVLSAAAVMSGIFGLISINFVIKYLEDRR